MTEFETQILRRLDRIDDQINAQRLDLGALISALGERCPDHQRQLSQLGDALDNLRRRPPNGPNGKLPIAWSDPRFWTTAIIGLAALATAIAAITGAR